MAINLPKCVDCRNNTSSYVNKLRCKTCWSKQNINEKHPRWKGDAVGYTALHDWVRKMLGTPNLCEHCKTTNAKKFEWANISKQYKRDLSDWKRLCTKCHRNEDKYDKKKVSQCRMCNKDFYPTYNIGAVQKYCGNYKTKTGCAHLNRVQYQNKYWLRTLALRNKTK